MTDPGENGAVYFTVSQLGIILVLSVLAAVSGALVPSYLFPDNRISDIVYGILAMPGPGAGVLIFGGILCFWLVLGLRLLKKPGTAVVMSMLIIAIDLLIGGETASVQTLDVLLFVALIIEVLAMLPFGKAPLANVMPVVLGGLGAITLLLVFAGEARVGENGTAATGFPFGYVVIGILALCYAAVCYRYPVKYLSACAFANMYYMLHFWLFWGASFAARFPATLDLIAVLLCVAAVGGILSATVAYGIDLLVKKYTGHRQGDAGIS